MTSTTQRSGRPPRLPMFNAKNRQARRPAVTPSPRLALAFLAAAVGSASPAHAFIIAAPAEVRTKAAATQTVNAREFSAQGDDLTDETAALQRALDGGRRTVLIPAGTYIISAALHLDSETVVRADPGAEPPPPHWPDGGTATGVAGGISGRFP